MATLRNKRKLAAVTRETQEENPRDGQSRNTPVPRIHEEYITQVSEEIEGRITKKLSQEFNRIEPRISDALSKLDEFLSNQQKQTHSKTVPGTFRNTNVENQGTNEDDSQSDPHPEGGLFRSQTTQNSGPEMGPYMVTGAIERHDILTRAIEETHMSPYMVTGVIEETRNGPYMVTGATEQTRNSPYMVTEVIEETHDGPDMVTGATGEIRQCPDMVTGATGEIRQCRDMVTEDLEGIRNGHDMVTAVQEEIPYCSPTISSGKKKKARFTSQPQFRSENTPATIDADQILLAFQQLPTNSNSSNVNNNSNRISKLPNSLTTTMPTFDGKSEKFELFEDLFQTSLKIHNQLTEEDKINYFHSLMRGDALQTFKNISSPNRKNLTEILTVFRRKYVKPQ